MFDRGAPDVAPMAFDVTTLGIRFRLVVAAQPTIVVLTKSKMSAALEVFLGLVRRNGARDLRVSVIVSGVERAWLSVTILGPGGGGSGDAVASRILCQCGK